MSGSTQQTDLQDDRRQRFLGRLQSIDRRGWYPEKHSDDDWLLRVSMLW